METIDPATGRPLPPDAIQRVLFVASPVHVYNIPPMTPGKGHVAASWTAEGSDRQIFTARLRVIETAIPVPDSDGNGNSTDEREQVKADVVLEDARTGQLFAAAPYAAPAAVEPVSDSSRFFALRVRDEAGRKATLGIGFEERSDAFDFGVALQEAQKTLGWTAAAAAGSGSGGAGAGGPAGKKQGGGGAERKDAARDLSLKEGETITINLPGRFGRRKPEPPPSSSGDGNTSFSLPPPPPPSANSVRSKRLSAQDLGFDDGKFGEFA